MNTSSNNTPENPESKILSDQFIAEALKHPGNASIFIKTEYPQIPEIIITAHRTSGNKEEVEEDLYSQAEWIIKNIEIRAALNISLETLKNWRKKLREHGGIIGFDTVSINANNFNKPTIVARSNFSPYQPEGFDKEVIQRLSQTFFFLINNILECHLPQAISPLVRRKMENIRKIDDIIEGMNTFDEAMNDLKPFIKWEK